MNQKKLMGLALASLLTIEGCATAPHPESHVVAGPASTPAGLKRRVPASEADFSTSLEEALNTDHSGGLGEETYKFVVVLDGAGKPSRILYQNSQRFQFHADFISTLPEFKGLRRDQIDAISYKASPNRKLILGSIIERAGDDSLLFSRLQFMMEDAPTAELVKQVYALVKASQGEHRFPGDSLDLEILPHQQAGFSSQIALVQAAGIQMFKSRDDKDIRAYTDAWNVGQIIFVASDDDVTAKTKSGEITAQSILLTEANLREIPIVAGVISGTRLTPASHLVLLGQMHGIPIVYHKRAIEIFKPLIGHTVYLNAVNGADNYSNTMDYLQDPSPELQARLSEFKPNLKLRVEVDLNEKQVRNVRELSLKNLSAYGGKASQTGILMRVIPNNTLDEARAIPIGLYRHYISTAKTRTGVTLESFIQTTLSSLGSTPSADAVAVATKAIRDEMKATPIPPEIVAQVRAALENAFKGESVRLKLRSSSNAEDGAEFNGAGLYDSEGIWLKGGPKEDLEKGLNKIWRSLYTERGYNARRRFRVDESKVGMGVLAQQTFKGEIANGVMTFRSTAGESAQISAEIYGYQGEEVQVTHGTGEIQPEFVSLFASSDGEFRTRVEAGYSGGSKERTLLRNEEYIALGKLMQKVAAEYGAATRDVSIECEWKLIPKDGGTRLVIKQVRAIPRTKLAKAKDGSKFMYIFPRRLVLKNAGYEGTDAVAGLIMPRSITMSIASATEQEAKRGLKITDLSFEILGEKVSIKNPIVEGHSIRMPNKRLPSLKLEVSLPDDPSRNIHSAFAGISFSARAIARDWAFAKGWDGLGDSFDEVSQNLRQSSYEAIHASEPLTDWDNPQVLGDQRLVIKAKKGPITVTVNKMKRNGKEGDYRNVRFSEATITGVLARPIQLKAARMYYGADHHGVAEGFGFDLLGDPGLTAEEAAKVKETGRFLLFQILGMQSETGDPVVLRIREDGKSIKLGEAKIIEGGT